MTKKSKRIHQVETKFRTIRLPNRSSAMFLMIACSILISLGGLVIRNIENANPFQITFYRSLGLLGAIITILLIRYRLKVIPKIVNIGRAGFISGVVLAISSIAFVQALTHTTVANTLFTMSAIPFFTAGLARIFLKEKLRRITIITMLFAGVGICIMVTESIGLGSYYGNLMALITAICFSTFAILVRHNRKIDMLPSLLVSGLLISSVMLFILKTNFIIPVKDILLCLIWGAGLSGLANWGFIVATRHLVAAEVTLFMLLEFLFGALWVWLFIGETPTSGTIWGGSLVMLSVLALVIPELNNKYPKLKRGRPNLP